MKIIGMLVLAGAAAVWTMIQGDDSNQLKVRRPVKDQKQNIAPQSSPTYTINYDPYSRCMKTLRKDNC